MNSHPAPASTLSFYSIHEAAELLGVSQKTLRRWEESGTLVPQQRSEGGHRRYSRTQLVQFKKTNKRYQSAKVQTKGAAAEVPVVAEIAAAAVSPSPISAENAAPTKTNALQPSQTASHSNPSVQSAVTEVSRFGTTTVLDTVKSSGLSATENEPFFPVAARRDTRNAELSPAVEAVTTPAAGVVGDYQSTQNLVSNPTSREIRATRVSQNSNHPVRTFGKLFAVALICFLLLNLTPNSAMGKFLAAVAPRIGLKFGHSSEQNLAMSNGGKVLGDQTVLDQFLFKINVDSIFGGQVTAEKDLAVNGNATVNGNASVNGQTALHNTNITGNLNITGIIQSLAKKALTIGGNTTGDIVLVPDNGVGAAVTTNKGNMDLVGTDFAYKINGVPVLSSTTLGTGITTSSLTTVGNLTAGSISSGFGIISTGNTITGTIVNGTTSINTGGGTGTIRIDASGNLINISNITANGTITFSGIGGTGIVHSDGSGMLSSSPVLLSSGDVTGILATANGGTGADLSTGPPGAIPYFASTGVMGATAAGTSGFCLVSGGTGSPVWNSCAVASGSVWQRNAGVISPLNITDDLALGGTATTSAKFQIFGLTGNATMSGTLTFDSTGSIQTTNRQTLDLGGNTTGNVDILNASGANFAHFDTNSKEIGVNVSGTQVGTVQIEGTNVNSVLVVDQLNGGDIFTASASGAPRFTIANNGDIKATGAISGLTGYNQASGNFTMNGAGNFSTGIGAVSLNGNTTVAFGKTFSIASLNTAGTIIYTDGSGQLLDSLQGSAGQCLISQGSSAPAWTSCASAASNYWQLNAGVLSPLDSTNDLSVGGNSTASAKFQVSGANGSVGVGGPVSALARLFVKGAGTTNATTAFETVDSSSNPTFTIKDNGDITMPGTLTMSALNTNGGVIYTNGAGLFGQTTTGSAGQCFVSNGGGAPTWVNCSSAGTATSNFWNLSNGSLFPVNTTLDVLVGGTSTASARAAFLNINSGTPTASVSAGAAGATYLTADGKLQTTANQTLTLGGTTTGNIVLNPQNGAGTLTFSNFSTNGGLLLTNGSGLVSQTTTGSAGQCLVSNGGAAPTWVNCSQAGTATSNFWNLSNGTLFPVNTTLDALIGGTSTASAKFAFINVNSGTPTASISASSGNIATYITGDGSLETTNRQTLTIGSSSTNNTTGNVLINPNDSGFVGVGVTAPRVALEVGGSIIAGTGTTNLNIYNPGAGVPLVNTVNDGFHTLLNGQVNGSDGGTGQIVIGGLVTANTSGSSFNTALGYSSHITGAANSLALGYQTTINGFSESTVIGHGATATTANQIVLGRSSENVYIPGKIGIGIGVPTAPLNVVGSYGSNAAEIINQLNSGDLFTASASGATKFTIANNGDIAATGAISGLTGYSQASGNFNISGAGTFATGTGSVSLNGNTTVSSSHTFTIAGLNTAGGVVYTDTNGQLGTSAQGTSNQCLISNAGAAPSWANCASGTSASNVWTSGSGAIYPLNSTMDLLLGGQSTASAKVAFINMNSGTPTEQLNGFLNVSGAATVSATYGGGNALTVNSNSLTTGNALNVTSTSTALTTGQLAAFDWSPGSATTATGDLFSLNVGANGIIGNLFNVKNNGSSVFSISQNQITAGLPTQFTSAGDVSMGYDLQFTNPTASFIKSAAPLYVQSGDVFNSSDLTLRTFNSGSVVIDSPGGVMLNQAQNWTLASGTSALNIASNLFNLDTTNNRVGINVATPLAGLDARLGSSTTVPIASFSGQSTFAGLVVDQSGLGDIFTASKSGATKFLVDNAGNVTINNLNTAGGVVYTSATGLLGTSAQGTAGQCLTSNAGSAPSWATCSTGAAATLWTSGSGAIYPLNSTMDLLVGGQSTASAKFAFMNVNSGVPTASIAGTLSTSALTMNGDGTIATTMNRSLALNPNGGNVGIGTAAPTAALQLGQAGSNLIQLDNTTAKIRIDNVGAAADINLTAVNTGLDNAAGGRYLNIDQGFIANRISGIIMPAASGANTNAFVLVNNAAGAANNAVSMVFTPFGSGSLTNGAAITATNTLLSQDSNSTDLSFLTDPGSGGMTEKMRITSQGDIGIGTTSPTGIFQVTELTTGPGKITTTATGTTVSGQSTEFLNTFKVGDTITANGETHTITAIASNTSMTTDAWTNPNTNIGYTLTGGNRLTVLGNGNVGIGTTTITNGAKLDLQGGNLNVSGAATVSATYGGGNALSVNSNSLTTGAALNITSTSTALTTGQLGVFDWSPGSATTATGDLFSLNVGANGTIGNIFNVKNNGSSVFSVGQNQITAALPTQFTAAGDVSMGYDLQFTNPTSSFIKSLAPLYVQSGDTFGSSDLTLRTFNSGNIVLDAAGGVTLNQAQNWTLASGTSALNIASNLFNLDTTNNRVGINTATPLAALDARLANSTTTPVASFSGQSTFANMVVDQSGTGDIFTASVSGLNKFVITNAGNVGIGTATPRGPLEVAAQGTILGSASGNPGSPTPTNTNLVLYKINTNNWSGIGSDGSGNMYFTTGTSGSATHMILDTSGNLTLGQASGISGSGASVDIRGTSGVAAVGSTANMLQLSRPNNGTIFQESASLAVGRYLNDGGFNPYTRLDFNLNDTNNTGVANNTIMSLLGNGNVGISNTAPLARLDVKGAGSGTQPVASMSGATTFANTIIDQSGSGDIFTASVSGATKFVITNAGNVGIGNGNNLPSAVLDVNNSLISTTNGISGTFNALTTGNALNITSTSTALTSGQLGKFDWSPGSATTATGDLFSLNVGANGTIGNIFNVKNNGSSVFSVGQNQITAALPTQFTAAGDIMAGYDLQFVNPTSSFIKSNAPLYIQSGETFNSSDLTLRTFNSGNIVMDAAGGVTLAQTQNWTLASGTSALNIGSNLFNLDSTNNRVGINVGTPIAGLDVRLGSSTTTPIASFSGQSTFAGLVVDQSGTGDILTASVSGLTKFVITNAGNVGIGNSLPAANLDVTGTASVSSTLTLGGALRPSTGNLTLQYKNGANTWANGITMDTVGNVGIGTSTPAYPLDISGSTPTLRVNATNAGGASRLLLSTTTRDWRILNDAGNSDSLYVYDGTAGAVRMLFDTSGNVGIGTGLSAIGAVTDISKSTSGAASNLLRLKNGGVGANTASRLGFAFTTNNPAFIQGVYTGSTTDLQFATGGGGASANADGTVNMVLSGAGNLGVGTTSPAFKLDLTTTQAATVSAMITNSNTGTDADGLAIKLGFTGAGTAPTGTPAVGNRWETYLNGNGEIQGAVQSNGASGTTFATNGIDLAEYFVKDDPTANIPAGTMVCQGTNGVRACQTGDTGKIIGIVSAHPAFLGGSPGDNKVIVALSGQVPLKVNTENGPILSGDSLGISSQNGVASKPVKAGQVVARALDTYINSDPTADGEIMVNVGQTWYDPDANLTAADASTFSMNFDSALGQYVLHSPAGAVIDKVVTASDAVIANVRAGAINAQQINTDSLTANSVNANSISIQNMSLDQYISQVVSGMQGGAQGASGSGQVAGASTSTGSAQTSTASGSGTLSGHSGLAPESISGSQATASAAATIAQTLTSTASAGAIESSFNDIQLTAADTKIIVAAMQADQYVDIKGSAYVGGVLGVQQGIVIGNSANGLSLTDAGNGRLSILNGLMTLDASGGAVINSDLTINGNTTLNGRLTTTDKDAGGFAIIKQGDTEVTVTFAQPYAQQPVITATADDAGLTFGIKNRTTTGFTIYLSAPATQDEQLSWTALALNGAQTITSQGEISTASGQVAGVSTRSAQVSTSSATLP